MYKTKVPKSSLKTNWFLMSSLAKGWCCHFSFSILQREGGEEITRIHTYMYMCVHMYVCKNGCVHHRPCMCIYPVIYHQMVDIPLRWVFLLNFLKNRLKIGDFNFRLHSPFLASNCNSLIDWYEYLIPYYQFYLKKGLRNTRGN